MFARSARNIPCAHPLPDDQRRAFAHRRPTTPRKRHGPLRGCPVDAARSTNQHNRTLCRSGRIRTNPANVLRGGAWNESRFLCQATPAGPCPNCADAGGSCDSEYCGDCPATWILGTWALRCSLSGCLWRDAIDHTAYRPSENVRSRNSRICIARHERFGMEGANGIGGKDHAQGIGICSDRSLRPRGCAGDRAEPRSRRSARSAGGTISRR